MLAILVCLFLLLIFSDAKMIEKLAKIIHKFNHNSTVTSWIKLEKGFVAAYDAYRTLKKKEAKKACHEKRRKSSEETSSPPKKSKTVDQMEIISDDD